ncbi:major facilitator superfamily transporter [Microdochium trichocladiopsis]|uniref:Major facilitator superfamily transporter n=1 Tax=Microdochium trichocladiopsis TaxID=1682393 RepID=A0A9P8Y1V1_9PEZI|nr:major facilitator superfamily transporter [Microdochium trichocladiopsis]KAH7027319.1 major facilitator superfamily transporter [Microdochium trichocladiopsis]
MVVNEQTPLLAAPTPATRPEDLAAAYRRTVLILCFVVIIIIEIGASFFAMASTAVAERNICLEEPQDLRDGEDYGDCKGTAVQGRLAMLQGWQMTTECLPGIIGAIPYGLLADQWGRRPVIILSLTGNILSMMFIVVVLYIPSIFSPEAMLAAPVFTLIGGSTMVTSAMAYTMIADIVPVDDRATVFFQFGAAFAVAELVSGPMAGAIMMKSNWLCMLLGLGLWIVATLLCFLAPETLRVRRLAEQLAGNSTETVESTETGANRVRDHQSLLAQTVHQIRCGAAEVREFGVHNRGLMFLMLSLVFVVLSKFVQILLLQFTRKKFNWSWSQAAFLLTIRSGSNLASSLIILPAISKLLTLKFSFSPVVKDAFIARATGIAGVFGALMIAFAPDPFTLSFGLVVFGLAGGMAVAIRSLLNALVESHHVGMLNTVLSLLEQAGLMVAGPLFSKALKTGIQLGGGWIGLPFLVAAVYMAVATGIVFMFRVPKSMRGYTGGDSEDEEERLHS